jgi:hypothetical protein
MTYLRKVFGRPVARRLGKVIARKNTNIISLEIVKQLPHHGVSMTVLTGVKAPFELTQYAIAIKQQGIDL